MTQPGRGLAPRDSDEQMENTACELEPVETPRRWFVLRVQSNREEQVRDNLDRLLELRNMRDRVPEILVPTEAVTELRGGKRQVVQRKLYPGYVIVQVEVDERDAIPQDLWQLIRETRKVIVARC